MKAKEKTFESIRKKAEILFNSPDWGLGLGYWGLGSYERVMVGLDCKVEGCETLGTGSEGIGGCGPWPKVGQKNVVVWEVEEGQKVEKGDMGYKDGKLVVVLVVVMVYMDD